MALIRPALWAMLALGVVAPSFAQGPGWLTRCNRQLGGSNDPETGNYLFETRGKAPADANARAILDYTASGSANAAVYPTAAKNLMNPYAAPRSASAISRPRTASPLPPSAKSAFAPSARLQAHPGLARFDEARGRWRILRPLCAQGPILRHVFRLARHGRRRRRRQAAFAQPAGFASSRSAVDAMKSAEVVLVQDGAEIAENACPAGVAIDMARRPASWARQTAKGVATPPSVRGCGPH